MIVGLVVVSAHIVFVWVMSRDTVRRSFEVVEVLLISLPITLDERREEEESPEPDTRQRKRVTASASGSGSVRTRERSPQNEAQPTEQQSSAITTDVTLAPESEQPPPSSPPLTPSPQINWHAELNAAAKSADERARVERERRTLSGLAQTPMKLPAKKPTCPFERCEPGWDAAPSVFTHSKAGRIEQNSNGETIRWINDNCYQILITDNIMHRAMTMCQKALEKDKARGDLFDHMRDVPPPAERATDVP